jgi:hypothetical protein
VKRLNVFNNARDLQTFVRQYLFELYAEEDYFVTREKYNACYMVELTPAAIEKLANI